MKKLNNLVIGIYFHPEAYPPTLNAISELSDCFDHITVVHRPHLKNNWRYPVNVTAVPSGREISVRDQQNTPFLDKVGFFFNYVKTLYRLCKEQRPSCLLLYDYFSLYAYHLIKPLLHFSHKVWYHNHDVTEMGLLRKYSIGWFAARAEHKAFKYLDIFSLPTNDRLKYFPMKTFKGKYFFIPNYPSRKFYNQFYHPRTLEHTVKLIFQGQVGPFHGIEEIIPLLKEKIMGHQLELVLKGPCMEDYKNKVLLEAESTGVSGNVSFIGVTPYADVPVASSKCHIGIGILAKSDIMNTTLGTASNKLYEYAAVGLPVIYYNSENFTRYLGQYSWALPADLNAESIREVIKSIMLSYKTLSMQAHLDFDSKLNFENGFAETKMYVLSAR